MFKTADEVLKFIKDEDVKFVDIRFTDLPGVQQHFNVPAKSVDADFFVNQGRRSVPNAIIQLIRPIGIRQTYAILPRIAAKYVKTELAVVHTDNVRMRNSLSGAKRTCGNADVERPAPPAPPDFRRPGHRGRNS